MSTHTISAPQSDLISDPSYGGRGRVLAIRLAHLVLTAYEETSLVKRDDYSDFDLFVENVVAPEIIALVVSTDYECTLDEGHHLAWLSDQFGFYEYPHTNACLYLQNLQRAGSLDELRERLDKGDDGFLGLTNNKQPR